MKGLWIRVLAMAIGMVPAAHAASKASCAKVRPAVRHLYCTHPALLAMDATLQALSVPDGTSAKARRDARRDQRLWQAGRDDVLWRMLANPAYPQREVVRRAWKLERSRQAFLLGRAGHGARLHGALARLAANLRKAGPGKRDPLATWAAHDGGVTAARVWHHVTGPVAAVFARIGLHPDLALRLKVDEMADGLPSLDLLWLPESGVGAVEAVQGSAACRTLVWFRTARGGVAHPTPAPMLDAVPCGRTRLTLLRVGYDTYAALEHPVGADAVDVSVQPWMGGRWGGPSRLRLRFDHTLRIARLRCTGGHCARYETAVARIARRYDVEPQGHRHLAGPRLRRGERQRADALLRLARMDRDTTLARVPFAHDVALSDLCREADVFLWRVDERLRLVRIGHGRQGWRSDGGWSIGFWDIRGGKLVPVAGAVVRRPRGRLLAMAAMPPERMATR